MSWFDKLKELRKELQAPDVQFLGEQDGPPERELKRRLSNFFRTEQTVCTAYLARVTYGSNLFAVALCVRLREGSEEQIVERVGAIFSGMFGAHEHLDIIFPSQQQEAELAAVCDPFFTIGVSFREEIR
jgi:hypothetical protein